MWATGLNSGQTDFCFEGGRRKTRLLSLEEIVAFTAEHNIRSRRVMNRIGMSHDPRYDFDHPAVPVDSPLRHHALYRIGAADGNRHTKRRHRAHSAR
jgi:RimJ/RimL family protein N-acetyltransferase